MTRFRWGIFGTGEISMKFVAGLAAAKDAKAVFVASRSRASAERFAAAMKIPKVIEGYDEAAASRDVDAIYIGTPPALHAPHAIACIEAGTPVLLEKPFATTVGDAEKIVEAARARSVFVMEAMWTRFLPAARALRDEVSSGRLGEIRLVAGSFGASEVPDAANGRFDPALGGGAISQLGVYPLSLGQWLFGSAELVSATGRASETGVDEDAAFQLRYPGEVTATFFASVRAWAANDFRVMGTEGMASFRGPIFRPHGLDLLHQPPFLHGGPDLGAGVRLRQHGLVHRIAQFVGRPRQTGRRVPHPYAGNGYHYEADEVRQRVARGDLESEIMPLKDSVDVTITACGIRDRIRAESRTGRGSA